MRKCSPKNTASPSHPSPSEDDKGLLYGETESTFVDIGIAGDGTYIQVAVSSDIILTPSDF